jgi:hypothetical protein
MPRRDPVINNPTAVSRYRCDPRSRPVPENSVLRARSRLRCAGVNHLMPAHIVVHFWVNDLAAGYEVRLHVRLYRHYSQVFHTQRRNAEARAILNAKGYQEFAHSQS